jgi:RNA polymerase sigma factor (sigma-70 family)
MQDRIERLSRKRIKFIDDSLYHMPDAEQAIEAIVDQRPIGRPSSPEQERIPAGLPPYLQALYRTPLLDAQQERALFLQFNFHKFRFARAKRQIDMEFARRRHLDRMERLLEQAQQVKNQIVQANLRLVVSVARRHCRQDVNLMELVSDGNLILMRAVESFDIHRGNRFSTYATLALMKGFARAPSRRRPLLHAGSELELDQLPAPARLSAPERIALRQDVHTLLERLSPRERKILIHHFGLGDADPSTYEQIGQRLGLSKQRIRQIEQIALNKLRP